jgi:hypothetical protein
MLPTAGPHRGILRQRRAAWRGAADELLPALLSACPPICIIALSGRPEVRDSVLAAGADAFVRSIDFPETWLGGFQL